MNDSDVPQHPHSQANDEESGVKRYRADQARSPRRPPIVNMSILIVGIGLILFAIYQLFFTRPVLFSDEGSISASIEEVSELFDVPSRIRMTLVRLERGTSSSFVPVETMPDTAGGGTAGRHLVEIQGVALYRVETGGILEGLSTEDGTVHIDMPPAMLSSVTLDRDGVRFVGQPEPSEGGAGAEREDEVREQAAAAVEEIARRDTVALRTAEERARNVLTLLVQQRDMSVEFHSNESED